MDVSKSLIFSWNLCNRIARERTIGKPTKADNAVWMKKTLTELGPAYIKIGQLISTRTDLVPKYMINELTSLQNEVAPICSSIMYDIACQELIHESICYFDKIPVSTASIGQIHRIVLEQYPNETLVLKIQKPGIKEDLVDDFEDLIQTLEWITKIFPQNRKMIDTKMMIIECANEIHKELDFNNELKNMKTMRTLFVNDPNIQIPRTISSCCTDKVLLMEYLPSAKIDSVGIHPRIANQLMYSVSANALQNGFIHGDIHPGNIGVSGNDTIVLYDFGLILPIPTKIFRMLLFSLLSKDVSNVYDIILKYEIVFLIKEDNTDLYELCTYLVDYIYHLDIKRLIAEIRGNDMIDENDLSFVVNPNMYMLIRAFSLLEGTCKTINANFKYTDNFINLIFDFVDVEYILQRVVSDVGFVMKNMGNTIV